MSNRILIYLTGIVIVAIGVLFFLNLNDLFQPLKSEKYLSFNGVRSIAIIHKEIPYLLNFEQQNKLIEILNTSITFPKQTMPEATTFDFEKIIIYPFGSPDIEITPIAYINNNLVFSAPLWNQNLLSENSHGRLKNLLSETFDP